MLFSRRFGEGRNPFSILRKNQKAKWIPAFAGMTVLRLRPSPG
jgi:hypothetical protein